MSEVALELGVPDERWRNVLAGAMVKIASDLRGERALLSGMMIFCAALMAAFPCRAADGENFYSGKRLTYIVGNSPGGGYDLYSRILVSYWQRHIPGNPTFVVQNMPVASGVGAANHLFNVAPKDGTYFGMCSAGIILTAALGSSQVKYRPADFGWIGTIATMTDILAVLKSTGVATIEDAKKNQVLLGSIGKGSTLSMQPRLVNALLDTKFKIVSGYAGGSEVNIAMDRGEVSGRTNQWESWNLQRPNWIADGSLNYLLQFGPKIPELPKVPTFRELVSAPDAPLVDLLEVLQYIGRSVFTAPGVPPDRLTVLRRAFDETLKDPEFVYRMQEAKLGLLPRDGEETQAYIAKAVSIDPQTVQRFNQIVDAN